MPDVNITNPVFKDRGVGELTTDLGGQITPMSSNFAQQAQIIPFTSDSAYKPLGPTAAKMRVDNMPDFFNKQRNMVNTSWASSKSPTWEGQDYKPDDYREQLHSGDYVQKFGTTYIGTDNAERLGERDRNTFSRHVVRAQQKIISSALGTIATLPSLVFGISEGSYESTYNNAFTNMLEDWDKTTETNNQVYNTRAEQKSFWGKGGLDFVGSTLETSAFTVGTLAGELAMTALTGGGYAPAAAGELFLKFGSKIPKILRTAEAISEVGGAISGSMKGLNKVLGAEKVTDAVKWFNRGSDLVKNTNTARFLYTSGAFEAGVETNTYKKIAENNFWDEMDRTGKKPSDTEISNFYSKLDESALGVNLANHVILGISNAALFGSMVGIDGTLKNIGKSWGKNALIKTAESKLFGIGTEEITKGVFKGISPSLVQNSARLAFDISKGFISEGVWEEGHQGIAQKMATQYVKTAYDKDHSNKTFDFLDSYLTSGEEEFGSSDGLKEVIMGGLIGGVFHTVGSAKNQIKGETQSKRNETFAEVQNSAYEISNLLGSSAYTREDLSAKIQNLNRQISTDNYVSEVIGESNPLHGDLALTQKIISGMEQAHKVGKEDYFNDVLDNSIYQLDNKKLESSLGLNESEAEEYKKTISNQLKQTRESYSANRKFVDTLFPNRNFKIKELDGTPAGDVADTMAYVLTLGGASQNAASNLHQTIQRTATELGASYDELQALDIASALHFSETAQSGSVLMKTIFDLSELNKQKSEKEKSIILADAAITSLKTRRDLHNKSNENLDNNIEELNLQLNEHNADRLKIIQDIENIDQQIEDHKKNLEVIGSVKMNNFYKNLGIKKETSIDNLINYKEALDSLLKKTQSLNPQDAAEFEGLINTLGSAININEDFQSLAQRMLNPDTMYSTAKNILSGSPKPMSEQTIEAFVNSVNRKWGKLQEIEINNENSQNDEIILEDEIQQPEYTIENKDDKFYLLNSSGEELTTKDGETILFDSEQEAEQFRKEYEQTIKPEEISMEIKPEDKSLKSEIIEIKGDFQIVKNEGFETGWSIINNKTGEKEKFKLDKSDLNNITYDTTLNLLDEAKVKLQELGQNYSVSEDFESEENTDEIDIKADDKKELDYKPERKKYKITKKDILQTLKAISSTVFGAPLDLSTILQAYDNVYVSQAKEKYGEEEYDSEGLDDGYNIIGTNIHHLHFSSFYKMMINNGIKVSTKEGIEITMEDAQKLDNEKYGWGGIMLQLKNSEDKIEIYRKLGNPYFTIKESSVKVGKNKILTTSDDFFQKLTGTKIVEQSGGNTTYRMVYASNNDNSKFEPLKSNFKHPMGKPSEVAAKSIKKGSKVTFNYDEKLEYNDQFLDKNTENYFRNAIIVVKYEGKVIGYLKAAGRSDKALLALRSNIILKKEGNAKSQAPTAELKMVLPGSLKVTLNEKGEVNWTPIKKGENDGQIISYGFVECERMKPNGRPNNVYSIENKSITKLNLTHTKNMAKNLKTGERLYYAVVMHVGKYFAIPITTNVAIKGIKPTEIQKKMEKLITLTQLSISTKDVTDLNVLLNLHNKKNPKNKIPLIKDLDNLKSRVSEYKLNKGSLFNKTGSKKITIWENLKKTDKNIMVELNNTSIFHNPKPMIDFTTVNIGIIKPENKVTKTIEKQVKNSKKDC